MALPITITDAGREEIINAQNTGTDPVEIVEVAVGTGQYTPGPSQTALQNEVKRLASLAGLIVADDTIHVTAKDESNDQYDVGEFGLLTASGTLLAVYSAASGGPVAQKAAGSSLLIAVDLVLQTLDATNLTFGDISFTNPPASETVAGVARMATQTQTNAGTDNSTMVSPKKLADYFLFKLGQVSTVANTFLRRTADNNQFEAKTPQAVANELAPLLPLASSTAPGPVELATQVEMNAEADTARVPPVKVIATYVANKITDLVNAAPNTLDTLNELAAALGDDPNFATTVMNLIDSKLDKTGKAADSHLLDGISRPQLMRSDVDQNFGGTLNYFPDKGVILALDGKAAMERHSAAGALSFGADQSLIVGAGESRATMANNVNTVAENLHLGAEGGIYFYTSPDNWSSGWAGRHEMRFGNDGELTIRGKRVYLPLVAHKPENTSRSNTTLSADPHLSIPLEADSVYLVEGFLMVNQGSASIPTRRGDFRYQLCPLTNDNEFHALVSHPLTSSSGMDSSYVIQGTSYWSLSWSNAGNYLMKFSGVLVTGASDPGNWTINWAQDVTPSLNTTRLRKGSWIQAKKVS